MNIQDGSRNTPSRRRMLGLAGMAGAGIAGAGLAGSGALGGPGVRPAAAATPGHATPGHATPGATSTGASAVPAAANLPLIGGPEFPIGIFWPPPPFQTTLARYQEIADAGFTFIDTGNYLFDSYIIRYAMGFADQVGLKVLVSSGDPAIGTVTHTFTVTEDASVPLSINRAEATTLLRGALAPYTSHPSFAGFSLYDEPQPARFASLAEVVSIFRELAPDKLPYINLLPSNDPAYPKSFVEAVRPSLVSYDRYPLLASGDDGGYFVNFANVRATALANDLPAWIYIQTLAYNGHRAPTEAELRWQINLALAYGFTGIQYFTYWTPDPARGEGFQPALLTVDGQRTERYDAAKRINTGWLAPVGRQLKPLVSETVEHANETPLPAGATGFTPDDYVASVKGGAVVLGRLRSRDASEAHRWLFVANRSHDAGVTATVGLRAAHVAGVEAYDPAGDRYVDRGPEPRIDVSLEPGAAALYRLRTR